MYTKNVMTISPTRSIHSEYGKECREISSQVIFSSSISFNIKVRLNQFHVIKKNKILINKWTKIFVLVNYLHNFTSNY